MLQFIPSNPKYNMILGRLPIDLSHYQTIEIVSKMILRHANLSTTQRYLGTESDVEAMRWIDNVYG